MLNAGFAALSVLLSSARSILSKRMSAASGSLSAFGAVNVQLSLFALLPIIIYAATDGFRLPSGITVLFALLYAVFTLLAQLFYMRALGQGEISAVTFFYSCGFVIPTVCGAILYKEPVSIWQAAGGIVMLVSFYLCAHSGKAKNADADTEKTSVGKGKVWLLYALGATVSSGVVGVIQKLHRNSPAKEEIDQFLVIAFSAELILSLLLLLTGTKEKKETREAGKSGILRISPEATACGVCIGGANLLNLYLSGVLPSFVFYPAVNGGVVVVSALAAMVLFREKPGKQRALGIVLGIAAILLIAMR